MKKYIRPEILEYVVSLKDVLLVSMNDESFRQEEEGVYDEVWK